MKKSFALLLFCTLCVTLHAQDAVFFEFSEGIEDPALNSRMERQISALLTAINRAETNHTSINYMGIDIDERTTQSISEMWNVVHFRIMDKDIVEHCFLVKNSSGAVVGYQVRNIAVAIKPLDNTYIGGDTNREACVNIDSKGSIIGFNFALEHDQWVKIIKEGNLLHDLGRRMQILRWLEQFQNAYVVKNIDFMEDFFGREPFFRTDEYSKEGEHPCLSNLREVFSDGGYVNVHVDSVAVKRNPSKPYLYGVTFWHRWSSIAQRDGGVVFTIWDFTDEEHPIILVRAWQPLDVDDDKLFKMSDFKLP